MLKRFGREIAWVIDHRQGDLYEAIPLYGIQSVAPLIRVLISMQEKDNAHGSQ
jgi:hypothetical protein